MGDRREFTGKTRKAALARSGGVCEASSSWYGLPDGMRCTNVLSLVGVQYDHVILDANSKDNSLENCAAVCPKCHSFKTRRVDTPTAAKTVAQSLMGMRTRPKQTIPSPPKPPRSEPKLDFTARRNPYTREEIR
ncbi:MAG: HNH endonuclease signature motif containing protein [Kiritimatiellales bacterium]